MSNSFLSRQWQWFQNICPTPNQNMPGVLEYLQVTEKQNEKA